MEEKSASILVQATNIYIGIKLVVIHASSLKLSVLSMVKTFVTSLVVQLASSTGTIPAFQTAIILLLLELKEESNTVIFLAQVPNICIGMVHAFLIAMLP